MWHKEFHYPPIFWAWLSTFQLQASLSAAKQEGEKNGVSFEPESNQRPKDAWAASTVLRSTN